MILLHLNGGTMQIIMTKLIPVLLTILVVSCTMAQKPVTNYEDRWKKVDLLIRKEGLNASALKEVENIYTLAKKEKQDAQTIKALMYMSELEPGLMEDGELNSIKTLEAEIKTAKAPVKNLLQSLLASKYLSYFRDNSWELYDRSETSEFSNEDLETWSIGDFHRTISQLYLASIDSSDLLKKTSLSPYETIITKGNSRKLRPSLYDLLVNEALEYFTSDEKDITRPAYAFVINDNKAFAPATEFVKSSFTSSDSSSLKFLAIKIYQELLAIHLKDVDPSALLDADLLRLQYMQRVSVAPYKDELYKKALTAIAEKYPTNEFGGMASYLKSQQDYNEALEYKQGLSPESLRFSLVSVSKQLANISKRYPGTAAAAMSENLFTTIASKELNWESEIVNSPGIPFLSKINYKNLQSLYYRIIKLNDEDLNNIRLDETQWKRLSNAPFIRNIKQYLPDPGDKRSHSVEIKIDALPIGQYAILSSTGPDFIVGKNLLTLQYIHISDISYISRDDHYFILNRQTGQPMPSTDVQVWTSKYDYTNNRQVLVKGSAYQSNNNGYLIIPTKQSESFSLELKWNSDRLFTRDQQYRYRYQDEEENVPKQKTFLFTDRSIYRPGQTVFFKGIVVSLDSGGRKSHTVAGQKTKWILVDANNEEADSLELTSNEFGSVHGKFTIPQSLLTGEYSIRDEENKNAVSFQVEEYKRPSFELTFDTNKGAHSLGDTIIMQGTVKAYSGNMLNDVSVSYRVVRRTRFPWPWLFGRWGYPSSEEMEITNGIVKTDASGRFNINFVAIPDLSIDKKLDPVFDYEVIADATDPSGETRSNELSLTIGYKSLNLQLIISGEMIPADSLKTMNITATNFSGEFQQVNVSVRISKLQSPEKLIRPRYWSAPDTAVMSNEEFTKFFPNDEYLYENDKSNWKLLNTVYKASGKLEQGTPFSLGNIKFSPGWYLIDLVANDKNGAEVRDKQYIQLVDAKKPIPVQPSYQWSTLKQTVIEPGQSSEFTYGSTASDLFIIREINRNNTALRYKTVETKNKSKIIPPTLGVFQEGPFDLLTLTNEFQKLIIQATEEDRGGIAISQVFVKHNRVFTQSASIMVPWSNKDLNVSVHTFRDKVLPGSKETWTLKITGNKGEKLSAELLTSLYDASLDQFKPHQWNLPNIFPSLIGRPSWNLNNNFSSRPSNGYNPPGKYAKLPEKTYDQFLWKTYEPNYRHRRGVMYSMAERSETMMMDAPISDSASVQLSGKVQGVAIDKNTPPQKEEETKNIPDKDPSSIQTRKNFSETAFFFPDLHTDENGNVTFSFTIPEALTRWKWQSLAHTKEMATGMAIRSIVTQKDLMVQPNMPRFVREGDRISLTARISNLTTTEMTGDAILQLIDPETNQPVDGWFKNIFPQQFFTAPAQQNTLVQFEVEVPVNYNKALLYRIIARSGTNSDGEENIIPVLSNRILVTESMPIIMRGNGTKKFVFEKLAKSAPEGTMTHHRFTIEYSSNPAWYGVLALPYLMEFPYECAEQQFSRFYANALAGSIANSSPKIKAVFEKWRTGDTVALISNLMKNQELKSILIEQTPWVMQAKSESAQRRNIAILFDLVRLGKEESLTMAKLLQMQSSNGGFTWFTDGPDDRYITQHILTGIAHLYRLNAVSKTSEEHLQRIIGAAIPYLDKKMLEDYQQLIKNKSDLTKNQLGSLQIQYLYMRSYFNEIPVLKDAQKAVDFYETQATKFWLTQNRYSQGMIALALHRKGISKTSMAIIKSLKENSISSDQLGMYWKDNTRGYYWYESPIETQALLIEAFDEVGNDNTSVEEMKLWLLSQKQVQDWGTTKATAEAVYALLRRGKDWLKENPDVLIKAGDRAFSSTDNKQEAGTGYFKEIGRAHV